MYLKPKPRSGDNYSYLRTILLYYILLRVSRKTQNMLCISVMFRIKINMKKPPLTFDKLYRTMYTVDKSFLEGCGLRSWAVPRALFALYCLRYETVPQPLLENSQSSIKQPDLCIRLESEYFHSGYSENCDIIHYPINRIPRTIVTSAPKYTIL